jgi:hypothetical protein
LLLALPLAQLTVGAAGTWRGPPRFARISGSRRDGPLPRTGSRRLDPAAWERVVWISGGTQIGYLPEIARDALDGNPVE